MKVRRAHKHINELKRITKEFIDGNKHRIVTDFKDGFTNFRYESGGDLPEPITLVFGDIVHNLRTAFDHAVFCLVNALNPGVKAKDIQLPIHKERHGTKAAMTNAESPVGAAFLTDLGKKLCPVILDLIYANDSGDNPFVMLHGLDNIDKHRLLVTIDVMGGAAVTDVTDPTTGASISGISFVRKHSSNASFIKVAGNEVRSGMKPTLDICIGEAEFPANKSLIPTVENFEKIVSELIDAIETCVTSYGGLPA